MKFSSIRWLFIAGVVGAGITGVVSSNVGCGDSGSTADGGGGSTGTGGGSGGGGASRRGSPTPSTPTSSRGRSATTSTPTTSTGAPRLNPDSGVGLDGGVAPTLEWSSTDGDPTPGSLKVTVTFTGFKQYIDPQVNLPTPQDFSGTHSLVKARIRLVSGTFPAGRRPVPRVERPHRSRTRTSTSRRRSSTRPA